MKKITTILVMVLMAFALTGCGNNAYIRELKSTIKDNKKEIADFEGKLEDMKAEKMELLAERDSLQNNLNDANSAVKKLKEELSAKDASPKETVSTTPATYVIDNSFSSFYVGTVFYPDPDGRLYHSDVQWYSNPLCIQGTEVKTDVVIISPVIRNDTYNNGFKFYTCMSTNGLVYASKAPSLAYK